MIPSQLEKTIRTMRICAIIELIFIVGIIITLALCFEVIFYGSNKYVLLPLLCLSAVCGIGIIVESRISKGVVSAAQVHKIKLTRTSFDDIVNALSAVDICGDGYVSFHTIDKFSCRMLVQYVPQFSKAIVSKQRKRLNKSINIRYNISANMSIFESLFGSGENSHAQVGKK